MLLSCFKRQSNKDSAPSVGKSSHENQTIISVTFENIPGKRTKRLRIQAIVKVIGGQRQAIGELGLGGGASAGDSHAEGGGRRNTSNSNNALLKENRGP
ncbi:hypothetical protein E2C01_070756 [Portunus trituberculatus]|uniref:Uncharacterized protein n=1 Tax=Portunus trituberculatus TaxID=210409 RepID=A0A5B7I331_PORTR|nr:hypothetical protein [Portunus trituberculatus]